MEEQNIVEGTSDEIRDPKAVLDALANAKAEAKKSPDAPAAAKP